MKRYLALFVSGLLLSGNGWAVGRSSVEVRDQRIQVNGVSFIVKSAGRKILVLPAELKARLVQLNQRSPQTSCEEFNRLMEKLKKSLSRCAGGDSSPSGQKLCSIAQLSAEANRAPEFTADVVQYWQVESQPLNAIDSTAVIAQVAKELGVPTHRVHLELAPKWLDVPGEIQVNARADSWNSILKNAGNSTGRVEFIHSEGVFKTYGRDLTCDLLAGKVNWVIPVRVSTQFNRDFDLDAAASWKVKEGMDALGDLNAGSTIERVAVFGARAQKVLSKLNLGKGLDSDQVILDLFKVLFDQDRVELNRAITFDDFVSQYFSMEETGNVQVNAGVE